MKKIRLILGVICCENAVKTIFFELHSIDGVEETHFDLASHDLNENLTTIVLKRSCFTLV